MGPIAVEMPPAPPGSPDRGKLEAALLDACSQASAPERCVRASDNDGPAEIVAVVSWQSDVGVRIEVAERSEGRWLERTLTFSPQDPVLERWQATGLAIGTLVVSHRDEAERTTRAADNGLTEPAAAAGAAAAATTSGATAPPKDHWQTRSRMSHSGQSLGRLYVDAGVKGGTAWGDALKAGPSLLVGARFPSIFYVETELAFAVSENRFAAMDLTMNTSWWTVGLGVGLSWQAGSSTFAELGLSPGIELIQNEVPGAPQHPARAVGHVEGKFRIRQQVVGRFWMRLGADAGLRLGETEFFVNDSSVGTVPLVYGGVTLATSFDLLVWNRRTP